ncbi:MAG: hypothetical protein MJH09_00685 [Cetobacterium sp.]|uniref:Uncharacterized protein n=1 Tax=Cetobacterium ceti TaxID=180163 RepID=A0A1T4KPM4_9FUSO|nr:hypothetical protein [Cetobacterium ceti]MCJ8341368.1 hypothetical protein [Cetobacterium sp.]SJZ44376.1 hypothetical protein SAMN02745174_00530 [Cetobacterium ceti]
MFFYEDFMKKVEKKEVNPREKEKFRLEFKKMLIWLSTGIPLILMGLYQVYVGYLNNMKIAYIIFGCIFLFIGGKHLKMIFGYGVTLNLKEKKLLSKDVDLDFDNIDTCTVREEVVGKGSKVQIVADLITKDRRQIIIPLIMSRKVTFLAILKRELGNRFKMIKD